MGRFFLGLGSNLGDRERNLARATALLARTPGVEIHRRSSLYESAPVGPPQPDYLNAVLEVDCALSARELLEVCKAVERALGRVPGPRWGPRPVDVDLLLADDIVAEPHLQVPHLELHRRAFALAPLCEVAPDAVHPVLGRALKALLDELGDQGVRRVGELYVEL
jgi:2-amino-4-hydroxy-6-hydroxymethyldihydropteridine diphosphokinase